MSELRTEIRQKKIIKTAWTGLTARIVAMIVSLLMVPLALHYLGKEQYGLWVAISSLVAMMGFMDAGAGNAVLNMVAHESGAYKGNLKKIISTAFFSLSALAIVGGAIFAAIFPFVPWGQLLGLGNSATVDHLDAVVLITGLFFFASMPSTLVGKIQRGLQEGNLDNLSNTVGSLLSLLFVYLVIKNDHGLIWFVIALLAGPMIAYLGSNIYYLFIFRKELRPRIVDVEKKVAKSLFAAGGLFFVLQIASMIQGQADNIIIANMLGPSAVAAYAICIKLFLIPPMLFGLILTPLWPAYREAFASGDMKWAKRIFLKTIRWSLLLSIPSALILIALGRLIIELWVGVDVLPSTALLFGAGVWLIFNAVGGCSAVFLNALEIVKPQIWIAIAASTVNIVMTVTLIPIMGVEGAIYGTLIAYFFCAIIPYFFMIKVILSKPEL